VVWTAKAESGTDSYVAVFNISDSAQNAKYTWKQLGLMGKHYKLRDLWQHKDLTVANSLEVNLLSHSSVLYQLTPSR
jgi:hypothetical protein